MSSSNGSDGVSLFQSIKNTIKACIVSRRHLRKRINSHQRMDRALHLFTSVILALNIMLIVYALLSITVRNVISNVPLLDTLPLAFYILPLMVILPKILLDLYRTRSAFLTILILSISAVVFSLISALVRGFIILAIVNIFSCAVIFITGRFRPSQPVRSIGKKGIAWFLIMNVLGLMMPVSVIVMGQYPIATVQADHSVSVFIEMPLADFGAGFQSITPTPSLIEQLRDSNIGIDLRYPSNETSKLSLLETWILALYNSSIPFRLTITSDRDAIESWIEESGSPATSAIPEMVHQYMNVVQDISNLSQTHGIDWTYFPLYYDMTISTSTWESMMAHIRSVDLPSFSQFIRDETMVVDGPSLQAAYDAFANLSELHQSSICFVVDSFVVDDLVDGDSIVAKLDGISADLLQDSLLLLEVDCSRTLYSNAMDGDIGEYLCHSYSRSPETMSIRLGVAGNNTNNVPFEDPVYETLSILANDMAIASGNGVREIVVSSLSSIISTFGEDGVSLLRTAFDSVESSSVTYTFRIYAFRAVMMAIDSFDIIML